MIDIKRSLGLGLSVLALQACARGAVAGSGANLPASDIQPSLSLPGFRIADEGLHGQIVFPGAGRGIQADESMVAFRARVGILKPATGGQYTTEYTARTDEFGRFDFPSTVLGTIANDPTVILFLQAENGLSNNAAGSNSARLRTFLRRNTDSSFVGTYNTPSSAGIRIDLNTTALCVIKSLRDQSVAPAGPASAFVGCLVPAAGTTPANVDPNYLGSTNLQSTEFPQVQGITAQALTVNRDPMAAVELRDATKTPRVYALKSDSLPVIQTVSYIGTGLPRAVFQPLDLIRVTGVNLNYYNQGIVEYQGKSGIISGSITGADLNQNTYLDTQIPADILLGKAQLRYVAQSGALAYATIQVMPSLGGSLTPNK